MVFKSEKYTESSKGFERKLLRVFLIIKNHGSFKNSHESLLSEPLLVAFIKNHRLKISLRYVRFTKLISYAECLNQSRQQSRQACYT